jgi:hypothetical protein
LLANPELYDGKKIAIVGFLTARPMDWPAVYLSMESARDEQFEESVALDGVDGEELVAEAMREQDTHTGIKVMAVGLFNGRNGADGVRQRFGLLSDVRLMRFPFEVRRGPGQAPPIVIEQKKK